MSAPRYLTKSRFKLATQCPTKLYYTAKPKVYANSSSEDTFLAMLADGGYQVGELAKTCFADGIEVPELDHSIAEAKTNELLKSDKVTIFEAAIRFGDLFIRIDILKKDGKNFELIEVKAKSYDSDFPELLNSKGSISSGMRSYIEDVAFQAYVFKKAIPNASLNCFLMMPDKSVAANVDGLNQLFKISYEDKRTKIITNSRIRDLSIDRKILAKVPVDQLVDIVMEEGIQYLGYKEPLNTVSDRWATAYKLDQKIQPTPGTQCGSCEFTSPSQNNPISGFDECWKQAFNLEPEDLSKGTILDIWNFRGKDKLFKDGRVKLTSVNKEDLNFKDEGELLTTSERQWMIVNGIPPEEDKGNYWLAEQPLLNEIRSWNFPYHFIDFETAAVALPFHIGMHPYEQVAFQFSHHVMYADGTIEHCGQFLNATPGVFPNFEFARSLMSELKNDDGTIFMWSPHENTILKRIITQLQNTSDVIDDAEELITFLTSITKDGKRELYDLCRLTRDTFFTKASKGSNSIKKVLPSILNISEFIKKKYSNPIYGAASGIKSKNFNNFQWLQIDESGFCKDPYAILAELTAPIEHTDSLFVIADGGAATTAYARLQFEDLKTADRIQLEKSLLKYCELDTFAMVLIVEFWLNELKLK
jgi:hypothetical protein